MRRQTVPDEQERSLVVRESHARKRTSQWLIVWIFEFGGGGHIYRGVAIAGESGRQQLGPVKICRHSL